MMKIIDIHTHLLPPAPGLPNPAVSMLRDAAVFSSNPEPADVEFDSRCVWCNTKLTDHGNLLRYTLMRHNAPRIVHGSEFPFRHIREVLEGAARS